MKALSVFLSIITLGLYPAMWFLLSSFDNIYGDGPATWWRDQAKRKTPKEEGPEIGTVRIVEKMDADGEVYYIYSIHSGSLWRDCVGEDEDRNGWPTPEAAQEAANAHVDEENEKAAKRAVQRERRGHSVVIGEFKP